MSRVGSAVLADGAQRSSHEIDIVGLRIPGTVAPVVLLGEVKHQHQPMGVDELDRLGRIRDLLDRQGKAAPDTRLLLVSAAGFTPELEALQRAGEVLLAGPGDLLNTLTEQTAHGKSIQIRFAQIWMNQIWAIMHT